MTSVKHILSLGAGVNSTALLLLLLQRGYPLDEVVFADTGAEIAETYATVNLLQGYLERYRIPLVVVKPKVPLLDTCKRRRVFPDKYRRWSTRDKKVTPIHAYYRKLGVDHIIEYIGIAADEKRRAKPSKDRWITKLYPLVVWGLNREDCESVIREAGLPVPLKSGCFFCPFKTEEGWKWLLANHPDQFWIAVELEESSKHFPRQALFPGGLRKLAGRLQEPRLKNEPPPF